MGKRGTVAAVKTPEERGPEGEWAYEARAHGLGVSPEQVVERLGRYDAATIRKAEANGRKNMSRPLWRALTRLYSEWAIEKHVVLDPIPMFTETVQPSDDVARLTVLVGQLVGELREQRAARLEWERGFLGVMRELAKAATRRAGPVRGPREASQP